MLLNSIEYWTVNNPIRGLVQRHYEAPRLKRISGRAADRVLEIGCGQGVGARIIYDLFEPQEYVGIDLDARMVQRARRKARALPNATFLEGDVARLAFADGTFDLVVDFGVVHHVPNWQDALAEIHRVLTPGGEFLFEDLSIDTFESGVGITARRLLDHPYDQMFRRKEFIASLESLGFGVESHEARPLSFHHFWGRAVKSH